MKSVDDAGNTDVYILDGALTLGVFTINGSGGVVSSYFNILTDKRVVGRETSTGTRTYYHQDLLASTRAVVLSTTGAVVESYDFEPWGLLMPGRTFGSGTKEWFTGKERDAETGLDYFGARYYMAALGRWTGVDPEAASMPEWSTYNYVFNNPVGYIDAFGKQAESIVKEANTYWDNVAISGHQQGGVGGFFKAAFATAMSSVIEYGGLNAMDQGTDAIAEGNVLKGLGQTALGVASMAPVKIPGLGLADDGARATEQVASHLDEAGGATTRFTGKSGGTVTREGRLSQLADDPNVSSADRGWIRSETRQVQNGNRATVRNPPGKDLRHPPGRSNARGYDYGETQLQDRATHRTQHRYLQERSTGTTVRIPKKPPPPPPELP